MLLKLQSSKCWSNLVDVGEPDARLRPPKTVDEFKRLLQQLKFTNGADRRVVAELYKTTLNTALGQARSLRYVGLRWGDEEMAELIKVLPLCTKLEQLNLKGAHNRYTAEAAQLLANALEAEPLVMPRLKQLGVGCRDKHESEVEQVEDPLLRDSRLIGACQNRKPRVSLERDVPLQAEATVRGGSFRVLTEHSRRWGPSRWNMTWKKV